MNFNHQPIFIISIGEHLPSIANLAKQVPSPFRGGLGWGILVIAVLKIAHS
ncbi:hypothetical protein VCHE48_2546 [Vibrio cholerae HE48]|nr:hypothetical protein VCHE48_2546 [Vibrio cholerae HE48]